MGLNVVGSEVVGADVVVFVEVDGSLVSVAGVVVDVDGPVLTVCCVGDVPACSRPGSGVAIAGVANPSPSPSLSSLSSSSSTDAGVGVAGPPVFGGIVLGVVVGAVSGNVVCVELVKSRR